MPNSFLLGALVAVVSHVTDPSARATLDTALARMGGRDLVAAVQRTRVEMVTEWYRTTLDGRPQPQSLGHEWDVELRDYTRPAWRYFRRFTMPTGGWREIVDLVVDSVAVIQNNGRWGPQNVAYVDERLEHFTFAPERLVLLARDASDVRAVADTTIGGEHFRRVRATINGFDATLAFRRGDGALALAHFRAAQPRDFGLVGWGTMDVAIWYSRWQRVNQEGLTLPMQLDVFRVGRPYKRMTLQSIQVNPAIPADSLAISDSLRAAFIAQGNRPMHDLPLDSAKIVDGRFALFNTPGTPAGAVKIGGRWLLLEAGAAPLSVQRSVAFLEHSDPATPVGGAFVSAPAGQGGLAWLVDRPAPTTTWVSAGARPYADAVLRGWDKAARASRLARAERVLRIGNDTVHVETLDFPDYPATAVLYVPSLRWAYAYAASGIPALQSIGALARARSWQVERIGSARNVLGVPTPPM